MEMSQEEPATKLTVETVVKNMRTRPTTKATQQEGVMTLYNMIEEYENTRSFLQCGGVEVLFDAMRLTSVDSDTQWRSMNVLLSAVLSNEDNNIRDDVGMDIIGNNGQHIPAILTAMRRHNKNLEVQKVGLSLLSCLMTNLKSDAVKKDASDAIIIAGGVQAIGKVMKAHTGNKSIEMDCMQILLGLVERDKTTRVLVWEHGGAVSVIRVMLRTRTNEPFMVPHRKWQTSTGVMLRLGCQILGWITQGASYIAEAIAIQGGVRAVVHAGPFLSPFQNEAEFALDEIAKTDEGVGAIVAQGGVNLLIARMQMWMPHAGPGDKIGPAWNLKINCETLARVASTHGGMDEILRNDGINLLLDLMKGCMLWKIDPDEARKQVYKNELQTSACNLLAKFADREDVNMCIMDKGLPVLRDVLKDSHATDMYGKPIRSRQDTQVGLAVSKLVEGLCNTQAHIRKKKIAFAKGIYRDCKLPDSLEPDIMQKILGYVEHGTTSHELLHHRPNSRA